MRYIESIFGIVAIIICIFVFLFAKAKLNNYYESNNHMIEKALDGIEYKEDIYNEKVLDGYTVYYNNEVLSSDIQIDLSSFNYILDNEYKKIILYN